MQFIALLVMLTQMNTSSYRDWHFIDKVCPCKSKYSTRKFHCPVQCFQFQIHVGEQWSLKAGARILLAQRGHSTALPKQPCSVDENSVISDHSCCWSQLLFFRLKYVLMLRNKQDKYLTVCPWNTYCTLKCTMY